jgi:hypothetical protein
MRKHWDLFCGPADRSEQWRVIVSRPWWMPDWLHTILWRTMTDRLEKLS